MDWGLEFRSQTWKVAAETKPLNRIFVQSWAWQTPQMATKAPQDTPKASQEQRKTPERPQKTPRRPPRRPVSLPKCKKHKKIGPSKVASDMEQYSTETY